MIKKNCVYDVKYITTYINYYTIRSQMAVMPYPYRGIEKNCLENKLKSEEQLKRILMMTKKNAAIRIFNDNIDHNVVIIWIG